VRYKINKIKELIAIDFTDISQLSNLFISYSINKYLEYEKADRAEIK
jgi:sugar diacid utilization regulator